MHDVPQRTHGARNPALAWQLQVFSMLPGHNDPSQPKGATQMNDLTLIVISSGIVSAVFLGLNLLVSAGRRRGVARGSSIFRTGNPPLRGSAPR